jgi:hypothetical protein
LHSFFSGGGSEVTFMRERDTGNIN